MHVTEVMGQAGKNPQAIEKPGLRAGCGPSRKHQSPSSCLLDGLPAFGKSYARPCVFNQVQGERSDASCPRMLSSEGPAIAISPAVLRRERATHSRKTLVSAFGLKTGSDPVSRVNLDDENLATLLRSLRCALALLPVPPPTLDLQTGLRSVLSYGAIGLRPETGFLRHSVFL